MKAPRLLLGFVLTLLTSTTPILADDAIQTWGLDIELLGYGSSFGGSYTFQPKPQLRFSAESDWTLVQSNETISFYNYWYEPVQVNPKNLSLLKLLGDVTYFPFLNSMHPSLQIGFFAAAGPILALDTPNDEPFIERWGKVESHLSLHGRLGVHLRTRTARGSNYVFRVGYDFARFDEPLDDRQTYSGAYVQAGFEFFRR